MKKIAIMESLGISEAELLALEAPFIAEGWSFASYEKTADPAKLIEEAHDAEVMVLANMPMSAEVLRACPELKFVDIAFTGVDHVGMDVLRERGVTVSNASGYATEPVAELVLGMALALLRNVPQTEERCRTGGTKAGLVGRELRGKTVGIVGYGKIGARTGELFHAFGARVLGMGRRVHTDYPDYVRCVTLPELLRESDIVVLQCPLTDATRGMIGKAELAMMKPTAFLINTARGPVADEAALAEALNTGVIAGAGIDVFTKEPPLDPDTPLLHAKNTIVTPHIGFASEESMSLRAGIVFDNLRAWLNGAPQNLVP